MTAAPTPGSEPVVTAAPPGGTPVGGEVHGEQRSALRRAAEVFSENRLALVGLGIVVAFLLFCYLGPLVYHTDQTTSNLAISNEPPSSEHLLGTDPNGYDQLGRLMYGGQASLEVGIAAALLATIVGTAFGAISGYVGGVVDATMMRLVDGMLAIPALFILLVLSTIFTPDKTAMILLIAAFSWLPAARLIRGEALSLRVREYVQAVRMMGGSNRRAILRHIAPNAIGTVVVFATFTVADAILILSFLGYLGLGIQPPQTDWGGMLSQAINYINSGYWWLLYPPGIAIVMVAIAFNFMGDALRDALEVRLQSR
ncbi:ABC transporter permease [Nocardioides mesophilus]|uniref:ABC transporter permease n=1 Tax=Nocardioides mesophilus TaxID=433659 RepID=A0A7G9RF56_9ACTN|nr:ABC transporter permease [Nocardioides mesophilus]QNN54231.1 ABC transporter permease [Nocardioides mesophilus]